MKSNRIFSITLALVMFGFLAVNPARAGISTTGDVDPSTNPATWTSTTWARIGVTSPGTLGITAGSDVIDATAHVGYQSGATGTATVTGAGSTWTNSSWLYVGYNGSGTLNITGGGAVSSLYARIGSETGSTGEVTVDGAGSTWTNSEALQVGTYGSGVLNITDGGAVSNSFGSINPTSEVTVDGASSTWTNSENLTVGGTLNITDGGAVSNDWGYIGRVPSSTGTVTVDGAGSTWTNGDRLYVGYEGNGVMNITDGGTVSVERDTWLAYEAGSSGMIHFDSGTLTTGGLLCSFDDLTGTGTINTRGIVSDANLVFDATHGLNQTFSIDNNPGQNITVNLNADGFGRMGAGYSEVGTMSISDGMIIYSTYGYIGLKSGSTGTVTVDGADSMWYNSHALYVGNNGSGTLNITNGGAASTLYASIGLEPGSTGKITVDGVGSTWTDRGDIKVGANGSGVLNIVAGGAVSNDDGYIGRYPGSTGEVTVDGAGSTWTNSYSLKVGNSGTGTLNIHNGGAVTVGGDLSINSLSTLDILLGSLSDPLLHVGGYATLDGTLNVALADGFSLNQGDVFTLIDIGGPLIGTFIGLDGGDSVGIFGSFDLLISYAGGDGNDVTLFTALPGDVDLDGFVDGDDLSTIITYWGQSLGRKFGDLNGNGIVDGPDYAEVLSYWNPPSEPPSQATPEPATLALILIGGLLLLDRRHRSP